MFAVVPQPYPYKQILFGARAIAPAHPRHYEQTENGGTRQRRIVNNCTTCSLKNLLAFFDQDDQMNVPTAMEDMLRAVEDSGEEITNYISNPEGTPPGIEELTLKAKALHLFLELLDAAPEFVSAEDPASAPSTREALRDKKVLMMLDSKHTTTLINQIIQKRDVRRFATQPITGHCYLIYPDTQRGYLVADSLQARPARVNMKELQDKLFEDQESRAIIIWKTPEPKGFYKRLNSLYPPKKVAYPMSPLLYNCCR